jgi:hypothetical protein
MSKAIARTLATFLLAVILWFAGSLAQSWHAYETDWLFFGTDRAQGWTLETVMLTLVVIGGIALNVLFWGAPYIGHYFEHRKRTKVSSQWD